MHVQNRNLSAETQVILKGGMQICQVKNTQAYPPLTGTPSRTDRNAYGKAWEWRTPQMGEEVIEYMRES